jgi:branched-chain amino acid transport system substrate-binding protein
MKVRRRSIVVAAPLVILATALSACGSSTTRSASAPSGSSAASASAAATAAATGSPINIGFANMTSGTISFPGEVAGAKVAVEAINNDLGGIKGHPLKLVYCDMQQTTQAAQACGQQFAGDSSMKLAMYTIDPITGSAFFAPLNAAGKPILGGLPSTSGDDNAKGAYFLYPGSVGFYGFLSDFAKSMPSKGYKTFSYLYEAEQSAQEGLNQVKAAITGTDVQLHSATMSAAAADFIAPLQAAKASSSDVLFIGGSAECPAIAKDMKTLSIKPKLVITNGQCLPTSALTQSPSLYEGWVVLDQAQSPSIGTGKVEDVTTFLKYWTKYGPGGAASAVPPQTEQGYGQVMTARNILASTDVANLTSASAEAAIKGYTGHVTMGGNLACPGPTQAPAECASKDEVFYKVVNGQFVSVTQDKI